MSWRCKMHGPSRTGAWAMALISVMVVCLIGGGRVFAAPPDISIAGIITKTKSSSSCIGNPITPVCAMETWNACLVQRNAQLCAAVGFDGMQFFQGDEIPGIYYLYRPLVVRTISRKDEQKLKGRYKWAVAGNNEIEYAGQTCAIPEPHCRLQASGVNSIFVKPVGDLWHVAGWIVDAGNVVCEHHRPGDVYRRDCELIIGTRSYFDYYKNIRSQDASFDDKLLWIDPKPLLKKYPAD